MIQPSVRCKGVSKTLDSCRAVSELDLEVQPASILALVGPSGCGKSTALRLVAGFETPDIGTIQIAGKLVSGPGTYVSPEKRKVGMVFQDYALFPHLSVAENISYGLRDGKTGNRRMKDILTLVDLAGLETRMPHELSGGQQQRVALARALAPSPEVLLLDEPFSNLDTGRRIQVREEIKEILKTSGATAIFVTHDQEEALFMGDRVAIMNQGRIEQFDTPERVFHRPETHFVANFMGPANFLPAYIRDGILVTDIGPIRYPVENVPSGKIEIMMRPDCITIVPSDEGEGHIVERIFKGTLYEYRIVLKSGTMIRSLASHIQKYPVGTRVEVSWNKSHPLRYFVDGHIHSIY